MNAEMSMVMKRNEEREALRSIIQQWNANRLDMFELSEPNEDLDFHGVMRFYFQDSGQKVATKCIRVASDATVQHVIETLIEKFRPDMRMLSLPEYALFEIHENGEERRLGMDEKPLLVQLNWHKDDREGRFLLRRINDKTTTIPHSHSLQDDAGSASSFSRKLSKREKKQLKKQEKMNRLKSSSDINNEDDAKVAEKLYTELPETSFTRSISNPEAVMRRRRQQKLEGKLQEFRSKDGGPDTGGTLKIYGESLCRDVPYKTLLLSVKDTAQQVVREMLLKYGLDKEDPHNYCLVQVNSSGSFDYDTHSIAKDNVLPNNVNSVNAGSGSNNLNNNAGLKNNNSNNAVNGNSSTTSNQEYILDDDECPLTILMSQRHSQGSIMFHVRRRPADYHPRKRKKKPQQKWNHHQVSNELLEYRYEDGLDRLPLLLELNPDGSEIIGGAPKRHRLHLNVTEVGCERMASPGQSQYLQLFGPNIQSRHCVIANTEGIVTVTPCSRDAETYVNNQRIYETTILQNGATVKFGRIHCFRFLDPCFEDRIRQRHDSARNMNDYVYESRQTLREDNSSITTTETQRMSSSHQNNGEPAQAQAVAHNYETTFDVDGNVETRSTSSQGNKDDTRSQRSVGSISRDGNRLPNAGYPRGGTDPILPAVLEIREETEEALLHALITDLDPATPSFKLAPAYCLYLMARYRASTHYRPELTPTERAHRLTLMLARVAGIIHTVIQERYCDKKSLALWLANSSELLNFLKSDRHISAFSIDAQDTLADAVQLSFRYMVSCIQSELSSVMPHFFVDKDDPSHDAEDSPIAPVLAVLSSVMGLLRRCRVNAALTIQLFSQLFYFINVWAFNRLVAPNTNYCSRIWGLRLKARLAQIEVWAERQGLELAADCHLARIVQAAHLLQAPKYNAEDLASLTSTCFKLNSLQLRALLTKYQLAPDEPKLPHDLIENVVRVAENLTDELARSDCREVRLEEETELALPFLLPEDGYSCEVVRGIPQGLIEFVSPLQHASLCRLSSQPSSNGSWTVYMGHTTLPAGAMVRSPSAMSNRSAAYQSSGQQEPEIHTIKLHKSNNGMGLSIVAAKGAGQDKLGIYIKSVVKGGAADADGRLQAGDQLLKVDGQSLVGITQEKAAEYLVRTGPIVTLEVAKQGAIYHGLATLLSQPSPVLSRGGRRISERDLPSRVQNEQQHNHPNNQLPMHPSQIHSSKSVPTLNSTGVSDNQVVSPPLGSRSSHEVFNPGYSRTSSTNSIHQRQTEQQLQPNAAHRSRSTQNLNDNRATLNYPVSHANRLHPNYPTSPSNIPPPGQQQMTPAHHPQAMPQYQHSPAYHHASQSQLQQAQQHPMYHQHVQQQQQILLQQQQQQQYLHTPNNVGSGNQNSNADNNGERFYQNLSIYRNQDMQNGYVSENLNNSGTLHGGTAKMLSPQYDKSSNNQFQRSFRGSQTSLQQTPPARQTNDFIPAHLKERPASAYLQKENYPPPAPGMSNRSYSTRDMIRQEAKLQEIGEEVRRREMRERRNFQPDPQQQYYPTSPSRIQAPAGSPGQHSQYVVQQQKPPHNNNIMNSYASENQLSSVSYNNNNVVGNSQTYNPKLPLRPAIADELNYRESPPPPPPPPTSTHPLYQPSGSGANNQRSPDNRYNASVGEPPKGGYYPSSPVISSSTKHYPLQGTNPWEREEREKEAERRREVAKEWRDQQIIELLALGPNRNQSQEEQLRALKLEKEFERRVQEDDDDEEDDQETIERVQDVMRTAQQQDRLYNVVGGSSAGISGTNNLNKPAIVATVASRVSAPPTNLNYSHMNGGTLNKSGLTTNAALEERERLRRLKELKMKQAELDSMRAEEQRAKQKEEELRLQNSAHLSNSAINNTNIMGSIKRPSHLRLDNLVNSGNNSSTISYGSNNSSQYNNAGGGGGNSLTDYNNSSFNSALNQQAPQQRLDNLLLLEQTLPPAPPERGSSSFVSSTSSQYTTIAAATTTTTNTTVGRNQMPIGSSTATKNDLSPQQSNSNNMLAAGPKKVSFQDPSVTMANSAVDVTPQQERINEDPNRFIYEAETMLASPKSPDITFGGTTPGVIGTQEVYKDPRQRRLAEQQQKSLTNKLASVPEKLTFKEKMKMFAMETGEEGTPKDKVKISRAQRDIDNLNASNNNPAGTQTPTNTSSNYATSTTNG